MSAIRNVFIRGVSESGSVLRSTDDPRVTALARVAESAIGTGRRLGLQDLGTRSRPLTLRLSDDPTHATSLRMRAGTEMLIPTTPMTGAATRLLRSHGAIGSDQVHWLDLDIRPGVVHEVGHGYEHELIPGLSTPLPKSGPWRTRDFERMIVREVLTNTFAALHERDWVTRLHGVPVRDARLGIDFANDAPEQLGARLRVMREAAGRSGIDSPFVADNALDGVRAHAFSGLVTPAFATIQERLGWGAAELAFAGTVTHLRRGGALDVPGAAHAAVRATRELGDRSTTVAVRDGLDAAVAFG